MTTYLKAITAGLVAYAAATAAAHAGDCKSVAAMDDWLATEYAEVQQFAGLSGSEDHEGTMLVVYAGPDGTWSLIRSDGDISCIVESGDGWAGKGGKGEPA